MSETAKKPDPRTIQLRGVRLSFTDSLNEKKTMPGVEDATPKHSFNVILEKDSPNKRARDNFERNKQLVYSALEAASEDFFKDKNKYKQIADPETGKPDRVCYRKGERFRNKDTGEVYIGYAGNMAIACGTPGGGQKRPKVYDRRKKEIVSGPEIVEVCYSGSYADVILEFYGTDKGGNGVFCTGACIRSWEEGDRIGGGGWNGDASEFDDADEDDDAFEGTSSASDDPFA